MNKRDARTEMLYGLEHWQTELSRDWVDKSLPDDWQGLEVDAPVTRPKTRVTVRLNVDMVRWFRKLGPGYGVRLNAVLRIYWLALMAGHISGYPNDNTLPRIAVAAQDIMDRYRKGRRD